MPDENPDAVELDAVLARLRETVDERRRTGQYPPHLELDLDQHFERIVGLHPAGDSLLRRRMDEVMRASQIGRERILTTSRLPGGGAAHRAVGKLVSRQTDGILSQLRWYAGTVRETLELIVEMLEEIQPASGGQSDLVDLTARVDSLMDRIAFWERGTENESPEVRSLRSRVEQLELELRSHRVRSMPSRAEFLDRFVGPRDAVLESRRPLVTRFESGPVLDLECGRGEMAQLLAEAGIEARGVESDPDLANLARDAGVGVTVSRPLDYLASVPDESLGGLFLGNVAERMTPPELTEAVAAAARTLRRGGRLVGQSATHDSPQWYLDPTHLRPVPAEYFAFLLEGAGFVSVETVPPDGPLGEQGQEYVTVATR